MALIPCAQCRQPFYASCHDGSCCDALCPYCEYTEMLPPLVRSAGDASALAVSHEAEPRCRPATAGITSQRRRRDGEERAARAAAPVNGKKGSRAMGRRRMMLGALAEALAGEPRDEVLSRGDVRALCCQGVAAAGGAPTAEAWEAATGRLCAEVLEVYEGAYYVVEGGRYYAGALRAVVRAMHVVRRG